MKRLVPLAAFALALILAFALRLPASAPAETQPLLGVNVARGFIDLGMIAPRGSEVTFYEEVDGARQEVGKGMAISRNPEDEIGLASIPALPWRCDRTVRRFIGVAKKPDTGLIEAFNDVRTPNCRDRIALKAPTRVEPGAKVPITLKDRWQSGDVTVRLCIARTGAERRCSRVTFKPGEKTVSFTRNAGNRVALLDLDLIVAGSHRHHKVGVGRAAPAAPRPVALVTGDSMMQGIDTILAEKLKSKYRVIGQTRPGTGVSKRLDTPWTTFARNQVAKHKPAVTIVLLGGNDGYPMNNAAGEQVNCCGEPWRLVYLERLKAMATAYARDGRGTVVWSLLPPPKRGDLAEQMAAVNDAIRRMAAEMPAVKLVELDRLFGPSFREQINGRTVRDPDGLHFSLAGQRMAAQAIIEALRAAAPTS
ncbi:MAG TPA: GDSL-type esterase/lipase family protein [Solirubrobacteraceae bacterium]